MEMLKSARKVPVNASIRADVLLDILALRRRHPAKLD
jgi:hypothetical protein